MQLQREWPLTKIDEVIIGKQNSPIRISISGSCLLSLFFALLSQNLFRHFNSYSHLNSSSNHWVVTHT